MLASIATKIVCCARTREAVGREFFPGRGDCLSEDNRRFLFTSESVTEGHPDKIADQMSDAVLDAVLTQDTMGRVACESLVTTGLAMVAGEITTSAILDYSDIVRQVIRDVGYTHSDYGFDANTCAV